MEGVVLPDGRRIFDRCNLRDVSHHVDIPEVDDVSKTTGIGRSKFNSEMEKKKLY